MYETPAIRKILKTTYAKDVFMPKGTNSLLSNSVEHARRKMEEEGLSFDAEPHRSYP